MYRPVQFSPGTSVPVGRHFKCQFHKSKQGTHIALHMCMHMHMLHVHVHVHGHVHVRAHVLPRVATCHAPRLQVLNFLFLILIDPYW